MTSRHSDEHPHEPVAPADRGGEWADLRARLRAVDPAASLPAVADREVAQLLEAIMTNPTSDDATVEDARLDTARSDEPRPGGHTAPRARRTGAWVLVAAAAALVLGGGTFALTRPASPVVASGSHNASTTPAASKNPSTTLKVSGDAPPMRVTMSGGDAAGAICLPPSAQVLSSAQWAVDAVAVATEPDRVRLEITKVFKGEVPALLEVVPPAGESVALVGAVQFTSGGRYLLAGGDGELGLCGVSEKWSPQLEAIYEQAFPVS